jgi:hypothetical protein
MARSPAATFYGLAPDETDIQRIMSAPMYESLPLIVRRLLVAEQRIAELEAGAPKDPRPV